MPDPYNVALKEFERIVHKIGVVSTELAALEVQRDQLRKQLKALAGGSESEPAASRTPLAVAEAVRVLDSLGGSAELSVISQHLKVRNRVAAARMKRALDAGLVAREAHGKYVLTNEGARMASAGKPQIAESNAQTSSNVESSG